MKNRYKNHKIPKLLSKSLVLSSLLITSLYSEVLLKDSWNNIGYSNAKNVMLSGATTATGKGHSALFSNPAGLSTNRTYGIYTTAGVVQHKNATGSNSSENSLATTKEIAFADNMAVGLFYNSIVLEMKPNIHNAIGLAYGLETDYGLFSVGANYVMDKTIVDNYLDFGTGDYYTAGFQWQKSFIGVDDFYGLYFGISQKGQGVNIIAGEQLGRISPLIQKIGFGAETDLGSSTILVSYDMSTQSWHHISDTVDTQALGIKWMIGDGFSIGLGTSQSVYSTEVDFDTASTVSAGIEFSMWSVHVAIAALQKEVLNTEGDVYMQDTNAHVDISFAF